MGLHYLPLHICVHVCVRGKYVYHSKFGCDPSRPTSGRRHTRRYYILSYRCQGCRGGLLSNDRDWLGVWSSCEKVKKRKKKKKKKIKNHPNSSSSNSSNLTNAKLYSPTPTHGYSIIITPPAPVDGLGNACSYMFICILYTAQLINFSLFALCGLFSVLWCVVFAAKMLYETNAISSRLAADRRSRRQSS